MRLFTTAWFAAGCGLALVSLVGGRVMLDVVDGHASPATTETEAEGVVLQSMTPAADAASEHTVMPPTASPWANVPIQRPRALQEAPPVAPLPFHTRVSESVSGVESIQWQPGEARLPSIEATEHWNPDDARIPNGVAVVAARAFWNPNSATLPRPHRFTPATWNPNDARLPSS